MYIFNILKQILNINESLSILKNKIIRNVEGGYNIEDINLEIPTIVQICNDSVSINQRSSNTINDIKNSINTYNVLLNTIYNETNLNYDVIKNVSEIYQFKNLMSYTNQNFKSNNKNINYISKVNVNNKEILLFNSMISSEKYTRNQILIYKTSINENGLFKHEIIPFIENSGYYHFNINIELEKLESIDSSFVKYKIKDTNGYITCIAYQNSIWEDGE